MKKLPIIKHFGTGLLLGATVGAITGIVITLYKFCAKKIIHLSEEGYAFLRENPLWLIPVVVGLLGVAWVFSLIYRHVTNLRGGGIPTAIGLLRGWLPFRWVRNVVGIFGLSLTTFLIGVDDSRVDQALSIIEKHSKKRTQMVPTANFGTTYTPMPVEVTVGGATVFVTSVERYEHL